MEQFRKTIRIRIAWLMALSLTTGLMGVYDVFFATNILKESIVFQFLGGASTAICIISSINIIRYRKIISDESKSKLLCNKENDERYKIIKSKAGIPIVPVLSVLMMLSGIIAGYLNITVFYTLLIAAICMVLVSGVVKLYYMKKM
ncbi:MAG TPA: hypothetical protein VJY54_13825 [Lachnospiraceae bacterium]|nr:hypothetical protein [Lachnospiraceae bacterium]